MPDLFADDLRSLSDRLGFELLRPLGSGGFGRVYLARQLSLDRLCAVKVLRPDLASDSEFRARFEREGRAASRLDHPNLVTVYDQGERNGLLFIAMQYVDGENLRDVIATQAPLHPMRAIALIEQGAAALDAVHRGGLIHRDVKPENFLVRRSYGRDELMLTDFGIAAFGGETSRFTSTSAGLLLTPQYAAPERWEGGQGTPATDVYALACVLFECLTGQPPFVRRTDIAYSAAHLLDQPPDVCDAQPLLPRRLDDVLRRGLAKDPHHRWRSAGEMLSAARQALVEGRATVPPQPQPETTTPRLPAPPPTTQHSAGLRALVYAVAAVVAVTAVAIGATRLINRNSNVANDTPTSQETAASGTVPGSGGGTSAGASDGPISPDSSTQSPRSTGSTSSGSSDVPIDASGADADTWMAQLASVPVGDEAQLESQYRSISSSVGNVKVVRSSDYASLSPGYWVIYYPGDFSDGNAAVGFCHQQGRAIPDDCFGRYLSHDASDQRLLCYGTSTPASEEVCTQHSRPR